MTDDDGDLDVFSSIAAACRYMEPIDVLNGVYEVFDSRGNILNPVVRSGIVELDFRADIAPQPDDLLERVRTFIHRVGPDRVGIRAPDDVSLGELLLALAKFLKPAEW